MKLKLKFSGAAIGQFFAENGEKLILLATVVILLMFVYGAITAKPLDSSTPSLISNASKSAQDRVNAVAWEGQESPRNDFKESHFAAAVDKAGEQVQLARLELNRAWDPPLFPELVKRADPEFFPVEDLRVAAGFGVVVYQAAAPVAAPGTVPGAAPTGPAGRPLGIPGPPPGIFGPGGPYGPTGPVAAEAPRVPSQNLNLPGPRPTGQGFEGKPRHYVVVTGVVPLEKQVAEYRRRFEYAVRDPSSMAQDPFNPHYIFFYVERAEVASPSEPVANLQWKQLDYKQLITDQSQWMPISTAQGEVIDPKYAFPPGYGTYSHFLTWPLPPILLRNWGLEATHPKVGLVKPPEAEAQPDNKGQEAIDPLAQNQNNQFAPGVPNFGGGPPPGMGGPPPQMFGQPKGFGGPPGMYGTAGVDQTPTVPLRLFRFVDLTAEPGKIYRYRVQLVLQNPNHQYQPQYLEKPESAKKQFVTSPKSEATAAVQVPPEAAALADGMSLPRGEPAAKINMWAVLKDPVVEVLTSELTLPLAGVAHFRDVTIKNVTDMATDQVRTEVKADHLNANDALLLDVRNDNPLGMSSRSKGPTEMLFMDPSGRLTVANSAVDSMKSADYHRRTDMPAPPPPEKGTTAIPGAPPGPQGGPPPGIFGTPPARTPR